MIRALVVLFVCVSACGGKHAVVMDGGAIPDSFVAAGCEQLSDCTPTSCQTAVCSPLTRQCVYTDKMCASTGACTVGSCDMTTGACMQVPTQDGAACTASNNEPGTCTSGTCVATPACANNTLALKCDANSPSLRVDNNTLQAFTNANALLNSYACAPTEAAPEIGYMLTTDPNGGDVDVTVALRLVNDDGSATTDQTSVDLDLIVLEGACTASGICANPSVTGGFAGITTGTSDEHVTFRALAGKTYYLVVDGKDASQTHEFAIEVEACGVCQPTPTTRLSCDMTMPVMNDTSTGAMPLSSFLCAGSTTPIVPAGNELPFYFFADGNAQRSVTANVVGATGPFQLFTLPDTSWGACDATSCIADTIGSTSAMLTWLVNPGLYSFMRYWLVVAAATNVSFGIELSCAASCVSLDTLRCGDPTTEANSVSDSSVAGPKQTTQWGPGAGCDGNSGLVGPEEVYHFIPTITQPEMYELTLTSHTAGIPLTMSVLDAGVVTDPLCNPTLPCVADTAVPASSTFSGTRTTTDTLSAGLTFTAQPNHVYFIAVDGTSTTGGPFDLSVTGLAAGAGCQ